MSRTWTIAQRELSSMFRVPAGWIIIALFAFLTGVLFVNQTIIPGQTGTLRYFFFLSGWLLIPIAPAISMRLMSEEYRSGSFEALRTAPAGDWSVTLGKYIGSVIFLVLMLVPTLVYPIVLMMVSQPSPDMGPILAGYLMLTLVGMLYLAIGMLASSLTASQTLAFLGTVMSLILLMVLTSVIVNQAGVRVGLILSTLSVTNRISELSKGIIDTSTIAFFLIGSLWMLILASGVLEVRRLGKSKAFTIFTVSIFVLATGTAAILAGYISTTYKARIDVTSTGAHNLSPRATQIVDRLSDPTEIILAIGMNRADQRSVDLVSDVLDAYDRSSQQLAVRTIDLDSPSGIDQTKALLSRLAERDAEKIESNLVALTTSADILTEVSESLTQIVSGLERVSASIQPTSQLNINNKAVFDQRANIIRVYARDMLKQGEQVQSQLRAQQEASTSNNEIFPFDTYADPIEISLAQLMNQLDDLGVQIATFADAKELDIQPRNVAKPMINQIEELRDRAAVAHDRLSRLEQIDALRVGRALETGEALLIIGAPDQGVAAVDLDVLLPSSVALERAGISAAGVIGPRAQELIASAIAQLVAPTQPILVFVHGGRPNELLGSSQLFTKLADKLDQRGIDTLEWAAVEEPSPPDLYLVDPLGIRPIVFALISVDSSSGSSESGLTGADRATEMGKVLERLIDEGQSVMISLSPSIFPMSGRRDPIAIAIEDFGLIPDSGKVIMRDAIAPLGRIAEPITQVIPDDGEHPITGALSGLKTVLPWAINIKIEDTPGIDANPIITTLGDEETWAESNWLTLWRTDPASRKLRRDQPVFNENEDTRADSVNNSWTFAASAQRELAGIQQRIMVIGSNGWASDAITSDGEQVVDGRIINRWPGNLTLLDSSIAWLAGLDDLIGQSTQARPIATIENLSVQQRSMIRWILLAGMPGLILVMGMAWRLIFG
jgi:gliding motility-associated transport system permease protein